MTRLFSYLVLVISMVGFVHNAHAVPVYYTVTLDGPSESPSNASPGTGFATIGLDSVAHTLSLDVSFSGLLGPTTAAHIHAATTVAGTGTAAVATQTPSFIGFPLGVTSGNFDNTANPFDTTLASTYRAGFITASGGTVTLAEAALFSAIAEGKAYLNIHTTTFPGGEIRGFLIPEAVPEPTMTGLMTLGILGFLFAKRRVQC